MKVLDRVYKKSRKPFQNGKRVGIISEFTNLVIEEKGINLPAVLLQDCKGPVASVVLCSDAEGLALMSERDDAADIKDILEYNSPI